MQLWSGVLSGNAAKVRIALAEKSLSAEILEVPWTRGSGWGPKPQAFLDVSPRAQVPVLIDGDLCVHDSTVIIEYLDERYPQAPLFPKGTVEKTVCRMWEDDADHMTNTCVGVLVREVFLHPGADPGPEGTAALAALDRYYDRLERRLDGREYICGEFSAADIATFMVTSFAQSMGANITQPNLQAWFARMLERPTVKTEFDAIVRAATQV
jgi:glutathione S-transferase